MGFVDYAMIAVIVLIIGAAVWYVRRAKKKGRKCIGCPENCAGCSGNCGRK